MAFRERLFYPKGQPPAKIYVHDSWYECFKFSAPDAALVEAGKDYVSNTLRANQKMFRDAQVLVGLLWREKESEDRIVDLFAFSGVKKWRSNPEVSCYVLREGRYLPQDAVTCGEGLIVLGREEEFRRTTKDIKAFMSGGRQPELQLARGNLLKSGHIYIQ